MSTPRASPEGNHLERRPTPLLHATAASLCVCAVQLGVGNRRVAEGHRLQQSRQHQNRVLTAAQGLHAAAGVPVGHFPGSLSAR